MARIITDNTKFNPFSFEDMLKPLALYAQEYRAQEDAISTLNTKASEWNNIANEQSDPYAYSLYKGYADDLASQAEILSKEGLSPTSRRAMLKLKERYNSEILPIEKASKRRDALAEEQRKLSITDPSMMWERNASEMSLDDFITNPNANYGRSYSGTLLKTQVEAEVSTLAKKLDSFRKLGSLDRFTNTWIQSYGLSPAEVNFAINHPDSPKASKVLNTIVNNVVGRSGIEDWKNPEILNKAYSWARSGLWKAIGEDKAGTYTNEAAKIAAQRSYTTSTPKTPKGRGNRDVTPITLYSPEEKNNLSKEMYKIKKWHEAGYLTQTPEGMYVPTNRGIKHANSTSTTSRGPGLDATSNITVTSWRDPEFREFIKKLGAIEDKSVKVELGNVGSHIKSTSIHYGLKGWNRKKAKEYTNILNQGYDANRETEFVHDYITEAEQKAAKVKISRALENADAEIVSYKGPKQGYTYDYVKIPKAEFVNNYTVLASKSSKHDQVFVVQHNESGKTATIRVPEVSRAHQRSTVNYFIAADDAYKNMMKYDSEVQAINESIRRGILTYSDLTDKQLEILNEYEAYKESYEDLVWEGEKQQGFISRGFDVADVKENE